MRVIGPVVRSSIAPHPVVRLERTSHPVPSPRGAPGRVARSPRARPAATSLGSRVSLVAGLVTGLIVGLAWPDRAAAQTEFVAEEPTGGLDIPATALAGEHDAYSVVRNPAGLMFVGSFAGGLGLNLGDEDEATKPGPGLGLYLAQATSGRGLVPRLGFGVGVEFLQPSRVALSPDPGSPTRLTLSGALPLGQQAGLGVSWHRFFDDPAGVTDGLSSFDIGLSARLGAHFAFGAVVRDVNAPIVAGESIQRRYELEVVTRPWATDVAQIALGGRIGETNADIDGWARVAVRIVRGLYLEGQVGTRELRLLTMPPGDPAERSEREYVATLGVEVSFGGVGATFLATGRQSDSIDSRLSNGAIYLRASADEVPSLLGPSRRIERLELKGGVGENGLTAALLYLRSVARDPDVVAVVLQIDGLAAGWATIQELRTEVLRVKKSGKKVFAYLVAGTTRDYFLATAADKIYLDPAGGIRLTGFAGTSTYVKGVFDKLGVAAQFEKIEEFKSAPEQWTRTGPSEPARQMRNELYDSLYGHLVDAISSGRGIDREAAKGLIDRGPYTAGDLGEVVGSAAATSGNGSGGDAGAASGDGESDDKNAGRIAPTPDGRPRTFGVEIRSTSPLVDAIGGPEMIAKLIIDELGRPYPIARAPRERAERWSLPEIAVIYINGDIVSGKSQTIPMLGRRLVGGDTIIKAISAARANPRVKAIVLRIDSPGGSALASELMAREVFKTRGVKPIICSMGDVAASGGYFAAAGCDTIFADPMTITGSIGIFYGKFDASALLSRLGVGWHTYKRGEGSDMESYFRPYSDQERVFVKERIRYFYTRFTDAVAKGRGMSQAEVDAVGRGRVWSGTQAKEHNLVDQLGGLSDALTLAKARIGLGDEDRVRIVVLPQSTRSLLSRVLGVPGLRAGGGDEGGAPGASSGAVDALGRSAGWILGLPGIAELIAALPASLLAEPDAMQARMPFHIAWD